jgi:hypothetical protein
MSSFFRNVLTLFFINYGRRRCIMAEVKAYVAATVKRGTEHKVAVKAIKN